MNKRIESLDLLFHRVKPDEILGRYFHIDLKHPIMSGCIDDKTFSDYATSYWPNEITHDEIDTFYHQLKNKESKDRFDKSNKEKSIFFLLSNIAQEMLFEKNGEPLCKYDFFLKWNDISRKLGEDIFTTAFLAYHDYKSCETRGFFSWSPIIRTTNTRLHQMLRKGVAENHFHLKGSAPYFALSWLSLMNSFENRKKNFKTLEEDSRLEPEIISGFNQTVTTDLYTLVKKAAFIRAFLFSTLNSIPFLSDFKTNTNYLKLLIPGHELELAMHTPKLQLQIELLKNQFGHRFGKDVPDYAIPKNIREEMNFNGNILLFGERCFLYSVFKKIFCRDKYFRDYHDLFYAYLVIKEKLRQELLQVNDRIGFANFSKYQDRKEYFIQNGSIYKEALYCMAVNTTRKNQNILSFETRISPSDDLVILSRSIHGCDKYINSKKFDTPGYSSFDSFLHAHCKYSKSEKPRHNHFYTLHFIKKPDDLDPQKKDVMFLQPRHAKKREEIKRQARAIQELRDGLSPAAGRIRGIDAASNEYGCRPEVFAQAFRFLKCHWTPKKYEHLRDKNQNEIKKLGTTYHAGEDFLDLIDGLRAIDEAVEFLELTHSDRLGHALALGTDPVQYYELKDQKVILSKHDLLDNIVWMLTWIQKYAAASFSQLIYRLEKEYTRLYQELYGNGCKEIPEIFNIHYPMYYNAWRLRGDDPMFYFDIEKGFDTCKPELTYWDRCALRKEDRDLDAIRNNKIYAQLYGLYHFCPHVKIEGNEKEEFKIDKPYIQAVKVIQSEMQKKIRDKGIGIETNPTSNYLIGSFGKYSKHPILNFFNLGLTVDPEQIKQCPQLFVSINTDDQGVFNTYLEKEYALMALALEKEEDENGNKKYNPAMIYDWLDRIRQMGLEQSFEYDNSKTNG